MSRYFLELMYKGEDYSGFQVQQNAITIQSEIEKAFQIFFKQSIEFTGSSRTDAGVHALQNYFHFDWEGVFPDAAIYNLNAILPAAIVIKSVKQVKDTAHCRFDAISRRYKYYIYQHKNPFLDDRAWHLPFVVNREVLDQCAAMVLQYRDFTAFSKRNTQVKTFQCSILESRWLEENGCLVYEVKANRFLRGMVRGLVATMVRAARGTITLAEFEAILQAAVPSSADFSAPGKALFLVELEYPSEVFIGA